MEPNASERSGQEFLAETCTRFGPPPSQYTRLQAAYEGLVYDCQSSLAPSERSSRSRASRSSENLPRRRNLHPRLLSRTQVGVLHIKASRHSSRKYRSHGPHGPDDGEESKQPLLQILRYSQTPTLPPPVSTFPLLDLEPPGNHAQSATSQRRTDCAHATTVRLLGALDRDVGLQRQRGVSNRNRIRMTPEPGSVREGCRTECRFPAL